MVIQNILGIGSDPMKIERKPFISLANRLGITVDELWGWDNDVAADAFSKNTWVTGSEELADKSALAKRKRLLETFCETNVDEAKKQLDERHQDAISEIERRTEAYKKQRVDDFVSFFESLRDDETDFVGTIIDVQVRNSAHVDEQLIRLRTACSNPNVDADLVESFRDQLEADNEARESHTDIIKKAETKIENSYQAKLRTIKENKPWEKFTPPEYKSSARSQPTFLSSRWLRLTGAVIGVVVLASGARAFLGGGNEVTHTASPESRSPETSLEEDFFGETTQPPSEKAASATQANSEEAGETQTSSEDADTPQEEKLTVTIGEEVYEVISEPGATLRDDFQQTPDGTCVQLDPDWATVPYSGQAPTPDQLATHAAQIQTASDNGMLTEGCDTTFTHSN